MQSADSIRDANVRYHDLAAEHYDSKWGINYDEVGQAQVTGKLRKALGHEPRRLRARARDRRRHRLLLAQPAARRRDRRGRGHGHLAGDARASWSAPPPSSALDVETAACEAAELPFEDDSFDLVFGHAVLHHLPDLDAAFREFRRVLQARRRRGVLRRALVLRRPHRGVAEARRERGRPAWRALMRAGAATVDNGNGHGGWSEEDRLEQVVDVHAFTPAELAGPTRAGGRVRRRPRERRGARGEPVRLGEPDARGVGRPARRALGVARLRLPRLPAAPDARPLAAGAAPAARRSSTTCSSRRARRSS